MFETVEIQEVKLEVGQLLKSIRKKRKISQADLAESLDVSRTTIQNMELGKNFTIDTLFKVLKELDLLQNLHNELLDAKKQLLETKSLY